MRSEPQLQNLFPSKVRTTARSSVFPSKVRTTARSSVFPLLQKVRTTARSSVFKFLHIKNQNHSKVLFPSKGQNHSKVIFPSKGQNHSKVIFPSKGQNHSKVIFPSKGQNHSKVSPLSLKQGKAGTRTKVLPALSGKGSNPVYDRERLELVPSLMPDDGLNGRRKSSPNSNSKTLF